MHWPQSFEWDIYIYIYMQKWKVKGTLRSAATPFKSKSSFISFLDFRGYQFLTPRTEEQRETHCSHCFHLCSRRRFRPAASASSSPARWRAWSLSPSTEALKHTSQTQTRHTNTSAKLAHHQHSQKQLQCFFVAGFWVELHCSLDIIVSDHIMIIISHNA